MNQLKNKLVNVILIIEEGKGFDFQQNSIVISANFNGRSLESDPINPEECPHFDTNFIWEIEKKELRKIRSSNQPLRIECLAVNEETNIREKIGHLLLDLRSAYIGDSPSPYKWYKLLMGFRKKKPELYLSLSITDQINLEMENPLKSHSNPSLNEKISSESFKNAPLEYLDEGYIKIGNDGNEVYSFELLIKHASNLDILLPEILVFHQNKNKYCMSFEIFGIPIKTKQFNRDLHDRIHFDEKIVVKLLSSFETMKDFFKNQEIEVSFYCGDDKLGISTIELDKLLENEENSLCMLCYFKFPSPNGIVPIGSAGRKPYVQLQLSMTLLDELIEPKIQVSEESAYAAIEPIIENEGEQQIQEIEDFNLDIHEVEIEKNSKSDWEKEKLELESKFQREIENLKNKLEEQQHELEFYQKIAGAKQESVELLTKMNYLEDEFKKTVNYKNDLIKNLNQNSEETDQAEIAVFD